MKRTQSEHILNIRTQIDESERALKTLGDQLNDLWGKGKAPKSFANSIDELANKLLSLREITKKDGMVDSSSLKQAESDSKKLAKEILSLKVSLQSLSEEQKKALVAGEAKEKMDARAKAVKSYNEAIAEQKKLIKEKAELEEKIEKTKAKKSNITEPVLGSSGKKVQKFQELQDRKAAIATNRKNLLNKGKSESSAEVTRLKELEEAVQKEIAALRIGEKTLEKGKQELEAYAEASKKVAEDTSAFEKEINELSGKLRKVDKALDVDAFEQLKKELKDLGVEGIDNVKSLAEIENVLKGLDNEAIEPVTAALNDMISSLDRLEEEQKGVAGEIDKTTEALKEQTEAAKAKEAFEGKIKQFLGLAGAAQVMRRALNDAFNTISELDAVMGQMSVVTDLSVGDYWEQLPEYATRAKELGVSITEAYEAATLYYQQGLKTNEVIAISTETMKMAAIAGISTADATDKMTAALRGFNMELNETSAQRVSDVYSELAAITAADVNEISDAMTKTASIASSAGMEFETTAAFLSQIIETTRESAETAGTALKTVIARFQELKKSPDEIGEIDGEIVDANAIETALRSVGVALRDSSGQFRELDDVFLELSSKWNTLDKNTQRYIATIAAGSRQQSRFIAMMQDYGRTQELVAAANNSAGASSRQFEKTTETLAYKLNKLKTAWQEFTMGILNSDLVKTGVDILTKFLDVINKATGAFDGLGGSITKIIGVVAVFNIGKAIYEKISGPISNFFLGELPKMAYESGRKSMEQYQKGGQDQINGKAPEQKEEAKKSSWLSRRTGWDDYSKAEQKWRIGKDIKNKEKELNQLKLKKSNLPSDSKEIGEIDQQIKQAENSLKSYKDYQDKLGKDGKSAWGNIGDAVTNAGQSITGAGVALSVFGGILSSMGFEEVGDSLAELGNYAILAGTALQAIPPILTLISSHPIIAALGLAIGGVLLSLKVAKDEMEKHSPEGKLKEVQEAAKEAGEAAEEAAENYNKLNNAFENLGERYTDLNKLTKGTKQWNEEVAKTNQEVLELIKTYPQLINYMKNLNGVLTIDFESEGAQKTLRQAEAQKVINQNAETLLGAEVQKRTFDVNTVQMDAFSKIIDKRVEEQVNESLIYLEHWGPAMAIGGTIGGIAGGILGAVATALSWGIASAGIPAFVGTGVALGSTIGGFVGNFGAAEEVAEKTGQVTDATLTDDKLLRAIESLSVEYAEGSARDQDTMKERLMLKGVEESEAELLAQSFSEDATQLLEIGQMLSTVKRQQEVAYDAVAQSAMSLANTLDMTEEEIQQASTVVTGNIVESYYSEKYNALISQDMEQLVQSNEVRQAIKEKYGSTARIDENGKVTYEKDGGDVSVTLDVDRIAALVATNYSTKETAKAIEHSDEAIDQIGKVFDEEAVNNLYNASEGASLTQADLDVLNSKLGDLTAEQWNAMTDLQKQEYEKDPTKFSQDIQDAWNALDSNTKKVFANSITKFVDSLTKGIEPATNAFEDTGEIVRGFMTADMVQNFDKKLDQVANLAGGEKGKQAIQQAIDALLGGQTNAEGEIVYNDSLTKEDRRAIQDLINETSWNSIEELERLQRKLKETYGLNSENLINVLSAYNYASRQSTIAIEAYDKLWQANEKVNQSTQKLTDLQWKYNQALQGGAHNVTDSLQDLLSEYKERTQWLSQAYYSSQDRLAKIYTSGGYDYKADLREAISLDKYGVNIDRVKLADYVAEGKVTWDEIDAYIKKLTDEYNTSQGYIKEMQSDLDSIEELESQGQNAYYELRDAIKETILTTLEDQINIQEETLNATQEANSLLIDKIQEQTDEIRRQREKEDKEQDITDLRSKIAYLQMDTSNDQLSILENEQTLKQAEEDYSDFLVDQAIQEIADNNEKAVEQRERQIRLAQLQLDQYQQSAEFQQYIDQQTYSLMEAGSEWLKTQLGQKMLTVLTKGMGSDEMQKWAATMGSNISLAYSWTTDVWKNEKTLLAQAIADALVAKDNLTSDVEKADKAERSNRITSLLNYGFDAENLEDASATQLAYASDFVKNQNLGGTVSSSQSTLTKADVDYKTEVQYIRDLIKEKGGEKAFLEALAGGAKFDTYEEYLKGKISEHKSNILDNAVTAIKNRQMGLQGFKDTKEYKDYKKQYETLVPGGDFDAELIGKSGQYINGVVNFPNIGQGDTGVQGMEEKVDDKWWFGTAYVNGEKVGKVAVAHHKSGHESLVTDTRLSKQLSELTGATGINEQGWTAMYKGEPYVWNGWSWARVVNGHSKSVDYLNDGYDNFKENLLKYLTSFKTGGLADFTGPAWLDGTPSRPEYILNADQTERFFSLIDILESFNKNDSTPAKSGDNYFDINIQVDKLENDYDVEQMANKIRNMIYEDATYRNVNTINHIR